MQKYIAIDLLSGTLTRLTPKNMICFFVVNKPHDKTFIDKVALEFIDQGIWYHFYGQYEPVWHLAFDETNIKVYPNSTEESVAMTCGYDDLAEFAEEIYRTFYSHFFIPTDVYLFYDDNEVYENLKYLLAAMESNSIKG